MALSLLDFVSLEDVVSGAQKSNILDVRRGASLRVWNDVVEMEVLVAPADHTPPFISLPDL